MPSQASICSVRGYMDHGIGRPLFTTRLKKKEKRKKEKKIPGLFASYQYYI